MAAARRAQMSDQLVESLQGDERDVAEKRKRDQDEDSVCRAKSAAEDRRGDPKQRIEHEAADDLDRRNQLVLFSREVIRDPSDQPVNWPVDRRSDDRNGQEDQSEDRSGIDAN